MPVCHVHFDVPKANLLDQTHYHVVMWAFDTYDEQQAFLMDDLVVAGRGRSWEMHPEVFNAQLMQLMQEDRYSVHSLVSRYLHYMSMHLVHLLCVILPLVKWVRDPGVRVRACARLS